MLVIGLMSGTSADGVDAALVEWPEREDARPFRLLALAERPYPGALQARIHRLAAGEVPAVDALRELIALDVLLADRFAEAAEAAAREAGVALETVDAIASHGQTVAHHPDLAGTLQIGCPSRLAERTGCRVVADFRARDLAAGGEGAPLAPFFHLAAFGDPGEARGVLNLGGIANLTWLPAGASPGDVVAFDVGPANSLVDGVIEAMTGGAERMDRDGARALRGRVDEALLAHLLEDDYLERPPPKSTGRERYGRAEAEGLLREWRAAAQGRSEDDLVATLVAFTIEAVGQACRTLLPGAGAGPGIDRLLVGGGGARNPAMRAGLAAALPGVPVELFDAHGVPGQAAEAMAFSLMGRNAVLGIPNHLPGTTGARAARVLGEHVPGADGQLARRPRPAGSD
jgi:anhydro-N-acetylmuramic acid kinase